MFGSIIIPTYNKWRRLELTLLTLEKQDCDLNKFEVIVVDDGSADQTNQVAIRFSEKTRLNFTYVRQENKGRAAARNLGVKNAKGDIILFLDDDRLVYGDYIREHLRIFEEEQDNRIVVLGKRLNLYMSQFEKRYDKIREQVLEDPQSIFDRGRVEYYWRKVMGVFELPAIIWTIFTTGNVSMSAELLKEVNMFNESFKGWGLEDTELGYRLWKQGAKFYNNEKAVNFHIEHPRNKEQRKEDIERNHDLFYELHPEEPVRLFRQFVNGDISLEAFNARVSEEDTVDIEETFYYKDGKKWEDVS